MTTAPASAVASPPSPVGLGRPYQVAADTWVIPELVPGPPGTFVSMNSMVITGDEPVIVDTGNELSRTEWMEAAFSIVDPADVRWIFLTHDDVDHHGNLFEALDRCPGATLVASWFIGERLSALRPLPLARCRWVNDGERFLAGERELVAIRPPAYDSPTTRGLFDVASGTYWASDCFGTTVPHAADDVSSLDLDVWVEGFSTYQRLLSPWLSDVDPLRWRAASRRCA